MIFLMLGTFTGDPGPYVQDEIRAVGELRQRGVMKDLWLRTDTSGVVALLEAEDEGAAQEAVQELPMVQHDVLRIELVGLRTPGPPPG